MLRPVHHTEARFPGSLKGCVLLLVIANLLVACGSGGGNTPATSGDTSTSGNASTMSASTTTPVSLPLQAGATQIWSCAFQTSPTDCGLMEQGADLALSQQATGCDVGREQWWEHSLSFPSGTVASGELVLAFGAAPNFELFHGNWPGPANGRAEIVKTVNPETRYDLTYHVKWSAGTDGQLEVWLGDTKVMSYAGRTLFNGCGLKLANYRSVIHNRVIRYDVN